MNPVTRLKIPRQAVIFQILVGCHTVIIKVSHDLKTKQVIIWEEIIGLTNKTPSTKSQAAILIVTVWQNMTECIDDTCSLFASELITVSAIVSDLLSLISAAQSRCHIITCLAHILTQGILNINFLSFLRTHSLIRIRFSTLFITFSLPYLVWYDRNSMSTSHLVM